MKSIGSFSEIYLCTSHVDFRMSIDGLAAIVKLELEKDVFNSKSLFVFVNRDKTRLRILYWDKTGFALWMKRLEKDRFIWPKNYSAKDVSIRSVDLEWLLAGVDIWKIKPHKELKFSGIV